MCIRKPIQSPFRMSVRTMKAPDQIHRDHPVLVGAEKCLETLFPDEESRPSIRSFREWQARRYFPHFKIGRRTFFNLLTNLGGSYAAGWSW
jgi:hypothetical protein